MHSLLSRRACLGLLLAALVPAAGVRADRADAARRGREFLAGLLDPELGLLPEYRGAHVYWLWHDNYLAAKVLSRSHRETARTIQAAIRREGVRQSDGKTELFFGEAKGVLPFRHYDLIDVRKAGAKLIRTEVATDRPMTGWEGYADLLFLASLAEPERAAARRHWDAAMGMWDGKGFRGAAARARDNYATFKLALALITARRVAPKAELPHGIAEQVLALQDDSGGWITDYDGGGKRIGVANVETTSLAILGVEAMNPKKVRSGA